MSELRHASRYIMEDMTLSDESTFHVQLKAWAHDDVVLWDCKRLFMSMGFSMRKGPYRILSDQEPVWNVEIQQLGWSDLTWRHASRAQFKARGCPPTAHTHDEASLTTKALLLVLPICIMFLMLLEQQRRCRRIGLSVSTSRKLLGLLLILL